MPEPSYTTPSARPRKKKSGPSSTLIGIVVVIVAALLIGAGLTLLNKSGAGGGGPGGPGGGPGGPGGPPGGGGPGGPGGGGFGGGRRTAITVGIAKAVIGQIPITLDALGTVTPPVTATITTRIAGNLMTVNFKEGQMVKKGQVLAQIDPRPYRVALEQAVAAQAHDEALLANAQLDLKRYQTLLSQNSIASQTVDTQVALVKQDQAQIDADKASVDNARLNLQYTTITAPVDGRVGLRLVDVGNYVPAGSTTGLVVLTVVDPMDVEFAIPEDNIPAILRRQKAGASLMAIALNRDAGQELAEGTLSTLDTEIDSTTGTVKAKARFNNADMALYPQQFVNIHLLVDTLCNQVIVPTTAVRHGASGDYVYTVQPDKTAKVQYVKTGPGTPETVSIVTGVAVGDTVITDGGDRLRDGSPVVLPTDKPQQGASGSGGRRGRGGPGGFGGQAGAGQGGFGGHGGQSGGRRFGGRRGAGGAPSQPLPVEASPEQQQEARDLAAGSCGGPGGHGHHGPGPGGQGQGGPGQNGAGQNGSGPGGQPGQWQGRRQGGQGPSGQDPSNLPAPGAPDQAQTGPGGHRHRNNAQGQGAAASGSGH
jgi:multidrug efflux system membrane fusion protein